MRRSFDLLRHPSAVIMLNVGAQSGIRLVSNILLSHLLAPAAFALVSITMLILTGIHMATDVGIAVMALRHGGMTREEENRLWTLQVFRSLLLAILMVVLAVPVSRLYEYPELATVMVAIAGMTMITGAQGLYPTLRLAHRDLMPAFWVEVFGRLVGAVASVLVALITPTVWALVAGMMTQAVFSTTISHLLARQGWPRLIVDLPFMRSRWMFGRWIQLSSLLTFAATQIDKALFPLLYGLPRLGLYGIGAGFALIPAQIANRWAGSVFFPLVTQRIRVREEGLPTLRGIRLTMQFCIAITATGVSMIAPGFFFLFYRHAYQEAAHFAALLAVGVYFELAELSLRHFPLADTTSRYEILAVAVRLSALLLMIGSIVAWGGDADLYAAAYACAPAISALFMLRVCVRRGYVRPGADLGFTGAMGAVLLVAYLQPLPPMSALGAMAQMVMVATTTVAALAMVYLRRGLPSVPREVEIAIVGDEATGRVPPIVT